MKKTNSNGGPGVHQEWWIWAGTAPATVLLVVALAVVVYAVDVSHPGYLYTALVVMVFALLLLVVSLFNHLKQFYRSKTQLQAINQLTAIFNKLPDSLFLYNDRGEYLNEQVLTDALLLEPARNMKGKHIRDAFDAPFREPVWNAFGKALKTGKMQTLEINLSFHDGKHFLELRFVRLGDHKIMALMRDITDQKIWESGLKEAKEAATSANMQRAEFFGKMSLELRDSVGRILRTINLLESTPLDPEQQSYLSQVKHGSESQLSLIDDMLDHAAIETGTLQLSPGSFRFRNETDSIVRTFIQGNKVEINLSISDNIPELVILDRARYSQILTNILAIATEDKPDLGLLDIDITGEVILSQNLMLYVTVKNNGQGIADTKHPTPKTNSGKSRQDYRGLDHRLTVAGKLAELMGGELQVAKQDNGSSISFTLTAAVPSQKVQEKKKERNPLVQTDDFEGFAKSFPARILLVDDNDINLKLMTMVLDQMGYRPLVARNGLEAVNMVRENDYDLIFMDEKMPKMSGSEAAVAIRKLKNGHTPKIIGLSAQMLSQDNTRDLDGYLSKPVKIEELAEQIRLCFEN